MEIEFHGAYTRQEVFRAVLLANKPTTRKALVRIGISLLAIGLYTALVVIAAQKTQAPLLDIGSLGRHLSTLILVGFFQFYPEILSLITAAKLWRDPVFQKPFSGTISSVGIQYTGKKTLLDWKRFKKRQISSDLIALLTRDGILSFFPRRFFSSDADWEQVIQLVSFKELDLKFIN
jgi:hypothetical protein